MRTDRVKNIRQDPNPAVSAYDAVTMRRSIRSFLSDGCCQSDRNQSPVDVAFPRLVRTQAMSDCHSAKQAERRSR